jgi:hypothetical protein
MMKTVPPSAHAFLSSTVEGVSRFAKKDDHIALARGFQPAPAVERRQRAWQSRCRVMLAANEFMYVEKTSHVIISRSG